MNSHIGAGSFYLAEQEGLQNQHKPEDTEATASAEAASQ